MEHSKRSLFPPLSPEETTDPETFALAAKIGVAMARLGKPLSEMEAISVAEALMDHGSACDDREE